MDIKKIMIQALVAVFLFIVIALIIEGDYSQEMIFEKTRNGIIFGLIYAVYIIVRNKFLKR